MKNTISNGIITLSADGHGAELRSLIFDGKEYLWQAGDAWKRTAPILFPFICSPEGGKYQIDGKEYKMPGNHGFARDMDFETISAQGSLCYKLTSDESTMAVYPFDFELYVTYELDGSTVKVKNTVRNTGSRTMYFYLGGHPAFNCPLSDGTEFDDWYVEYERPETIIQVWNGTRTIIENSSRLPLTRDLFDNDVVMKDAPASKSISLRSDKSDRFVILDYPDSKCIAVWSPTGNDDARFVCLEPWTSVPVYCDDIQPELSRKEHAISLGAGESYDYTYSITVG